MENPLKSLKRAPKWVWVTVAGVGIGAGVIKLWQDRGAEAIEGEGPGVGGEVGTAPSPGSAPGIVVPPVIIGQPPNEGPDLLTPGINLITGVVGDLTAGWEALLGPIIGNQAAINQTVIDSLANAGGPPGLTQQNPTPVNVAVTVAPATPQSREKPCCMYSGHPLSWWRNAGNARNSKGWRWPGDSTRHTRAFEGHKACDGGGSAGGSKREC
jgi:hypothetical protein